jgi:hypothetical protein
MRIYLRTPYANHVLGLEVDPCMSAFEALEKCCKTAGIPSKAVCNLRLVHSGRILPPNALLGCTSVAAHAVLDLLPCLRGGGGDGGSTGAEDRRAWLEMYQNKKHDKVNPEEERLARWTACHISGMPLNPPCVADDLGSLYNKDAVIQTLLSKTMPRTLSHITNLKHLIDVKLTPIDSPAPNAAVKFACPVTGLPMNGRARFVLVRRNGTDPAYILSERAIKELPEVAREIVGGEWGANDVMPLYPQAEELDRLATEMMARRQAEFAAKQAKKRAKAKNKRESNDGCGKDEVGPLLKASVKGKRELGVAETERSGSKKAKAVGGTVPPPAHADAAIWNSLFTRSTVSDKDEDKTKKKGGNNDFMLRGTLKYVV